MKMLTFEFRGSLYGFPLRLIAEDRARYYTRLEGNGKSDEECKLIFDEEFDFVMNDYFEAQDWFHNSMNPEDVADHLVCIHPPAPMSNLEIMRKGDGWKVQDVRVVGPEGVIE